MNQQSITPWKAVLKENLAFIMMILFFTFGILSIALSGKIVSYLLLVNEYGADRVKSENLKIVKAKPEMVISNGDVIDSSTTTPYYILCFTLACLLMFFIYLMINLSTKGWLRKTLIEMKVKDSKKGADPFNLT